MIKNYSPLHWLLCFINSQTASVFSSTNWFRSTFQEFVLERKSTLIEFVIPVLFCRMVIHPLYTDPSSSLHSTEQLQKISALLVQKFHFFPEINFSICKPHKSRSSDKYVQKKTMFNNKNVWQYLLLPKSEITTLAPHEHLVPHIAGILRPILIASHIGKIPALTSFIFSSRNYICEIGFILWENWIRR